MVGSAPLYLRTAGSANHPAPAGRALAFPPAAPMPPRPRRVALVALVLALAGCGDREPAPADPQLVAQWLRTSLAFVRSERLGPPVAARISAYGSIALFEGLASHPGSTLRSLAGQVNGLAALPAPEGTVDGAAVAATAERVVLDSLFRDGLASTRHTIDSLAAAQVAARAAAGVDSATLARSVAHGRALAAAILGWAATDGFLDTRGRPWQAPTYAGAWTNTSTVDQYVPQGLSGESDIVLAGDPATTLDAARASSRAVFVNRPRAANARTTLPTFNPVRPTEPYWGTLRPFALRDGDECPAGTPPAYSEAPGSAFRAMAQELYDSTRALDEPRRQVALFWSDNPVATGTPGFHWVSVVNQMIAARGLDAERAAELYALTSVAIADAFIGCWRVKYRTMVPRPVSYIRKVIDSTWTPAFATPPFPEYPSGHSTLSAAAARVLIATLGDSIPFVDSTQVDIGHPPRPFGSFSAARDEVAVSRVYGGIHFIPAVRDGIVQGECVGQRVLARLATRKKA